MLLTACSESNKNIKACDAAITSQLSAPSTYNRLKSSMLDKNGTNAALLLVSREIANSPSGSLTLLGKPAFHIFLNRENISEAFEVNFDAQNRFGALLRGTAVCFKFTDGNIIAAVLQ